MPALCLYFIVTTDLDIHTKLFKFVQFQLEKMLTCTFIAVIIIELFKLLGKPCLNLIRHPLPHKVKDLLVDATEKSNVELVGLRDSDMIFRTLRLNWPPFSMSLHHNWRQRLGGGGRENEGGMIMKSQKCTLVQLGSHSYFWILFLT